MDEPKCVLVHPVVLSVRRQMLGELIQHIFSILSGPNGDAVAFRIISTLARESDDKKMFEFPVYRFAHLNGSVFTVGCASPGWLVSVSLSMPVDVAEIVASGAERLNDTAGFPDDVLSGSYADDPNRFTVRFMATGDARTFFRRIARAFSA